MDTVTKEVLDKAKSKYAGKPRKTVGKRLTVRYKAARRARRRRR